MKNDKCNLKNIPDDVQEKVNEIVEKFNQKFLKKKNRYYHARFKGKYLYLDREDYGRISHICRLTYTGDINDWDFAIYKYSSERYDPNEWFFPGSGEVDGTIKGAMKAGLLAYP